MSTPVHDLPTSLTLDPNDRPLQLFEHPVATLALENHPRSLQLSANTRTLLLHDHSPATSVYHRTTTLLLDG